MRSSRLTLGRSAPMGGALVLALTVLAIGAMATVSAAAGPPTDPSEPFVTPSHRNYLDRDENQIWFEKSIPELQSLMAAGKLTSRQLTMAYLNRIAHLNPTLGAVIETNPEAVGIAARLDGERRAGHIRGPLHGIPILVKDNIATNDAMQTTAGSLALVGTRVPQDAALVARLREAGAVILGKTNLSEWANFRGFAPPDFPFATNYLNGWSARGGFTHDPYLLGCDPCGSSSGSAVAPAANLCVAAIGTETDGSIVCPAGNNMVVGLKPTVGLISQNGVIPIAHSQDAPGPMARSVTDVALLLNAMKSPFGEVLGHPLPEDYTAFLDPNGLVGARIGVERRLFQPDYYALPEIAAAVDNAIAAMAAAGAVIVDPVDTGDPWAWWNAETDVLLYEFKGDIASYLSSLSFGPLDTRMRTLADLIQFNADHCEEELKFFGQEIFEWSESLSGDLTDPAYVSARANCLDLTRTNGIDRVMAENNLDAVISPSYGLGSSAPACAGYPVISVPIGMASNGMPAGAWLYAGFLQEPKLLRIAYAMEQLFQPRSQPGYPGAVPADPPDAGLCAPAGTPAIASATPRFPGPLHLALARRIEGLMRSRSVLTPIAERTPSAASTGASLEVGSGIGAPSRLRFRLGASEAVELTIYDARGARVAALIQNQTLGAGEHVITWDGTDAGGHRVANGVYFCRLKTDSAHLSGRLIVVK